MNSTNNATSHPKNKRTLQAEQSREHIFEEAMKLFAEKGYDKVTVEAICRASNSSIGNFYHYFPNKTAVFTYLHEKINVRSTELIKNIDISGSQRDIILQYFDCLADNANFMGYKIYAIILTIGTNLQIDSDNFYDGICEAFRKGIECGEFQTDLTAYDLTRHIVFATRGLLYEWALRDAPFDLKKEMHQFVKFEMRAITK